MIDFNQYDAFRFLPMMGRMRFMSWEEMSSTKHPCPCGSGTYTVTRLMDDWNRSEERWEMDCLVCKDKFTLYESGYWHSGLWTPTYRWVLREALAKVQEQQAEINQLERKIIDLARSRYLEIWCALFSGCKSKKDVWFSLTQGKRYPSLATFYKSVRYQGLKTYIDNWFNWDHLSDVLTSIKVADTDIARLIQEYSELEAKYIELTRKL
jgi:hypothetical protein